MRLLAIRTLPSCSENARFLWKRVPQAVKDGDAELRAIWAIGKEMWRRNIVDVYRTLKAFNWSPIHRALVDLLAGMCAC